MENEEEEITEEQRRRAAANRAAALAKRKAILSVPKNTAHQRPQSWKLFRCRKLSPQAASKIPVSKRPFIVDPTGPNQKSERFRARLEICSPDSFSVTPVAVDGFVYPGEDICFDKLRDCLANVVLSHYTQNTSGGKACVYRLYDYHSVLRSLKNCRDIECEEIPWGTFNVIERLSHSFIAGKWVPCRPEHLPDEKVDELISELPKTLVNALLPFQLDGVRFGLRRGGRCLIADEMGLGKTLQVSMEV
ncbi:UNVERIFIED_CONTAM: SWI/SNF-related matrix-associated actin-dependent regulator of chromatin subfamily A-like protein 1 [Sesamum radiatum]|uniref:SWI/SNF-related matrix-associated actin-dependent regulator of chromatin subfamily A-like protein 1 n=1 Tax=Sesamum radiatum TaxID=300843 RepID=A0AAW2RXJ4_SESRA